MLFPYKKFNCIVFYVNKIIMDVIIDLKFEK